MIGTQEALNKILDIVAPGQPVEIPLEQALGCFLSEDVAAFLPLPHFDNSAMDGYAVRVADVSGASEQSPVELLITRVIPAGDDVSDSDKFSVGEGETAQIFTGAMMPAGVDTVIRQEDIETLPGGRIAVKAPQRPGQHIRKRGEEVGLGEIVLRAGDEINPAAMAVLANFGFTSVNVIRRPTVGCLVTGSELVPAGHALPAGKIYDSNSIMLNSAIAQMGLSVGYRRSCPDDRDALTASVKEALAACDVVLVSGGVSVGDYDFVKDVAGAVGIEEVFWRILQKPGKPFFFGASAERDKFLFGLPGNPASALTCFYEYVKPAFRRIMGAGEPRPAAIKARLSEAFAKREGLTHFLKGHYQADGAVTVLERQGSHMMSSFAQANCLVVIPAEVSNLEKGAEVTIHLLS